MALLNQQPQPAQPVQQPVQQAQPTAQSANVDSDRLQKHIQNIVQAAHALMYSESTRKNFMEELQAHLGNGEKPKLAAARTAIGVMKLLFMQSQGKMAKQAFIPAGIMIAGEVLDLIASSQKYDPTDKDANDTILLFIEECKKLEPSEQPQQAQAPQQPAMQGA